MIYRPVVVTPFAQIASSLKKKTQIKKSAKISRKSRLFKNKTVNLFTLEDERNNLAEDERNDEIEFAQALYNIEELAGCSTAQSVYFENIYEYVRLGKRLGKNVSLESALSIPRNNHADAWPCDEWSS
jgi:hypothetical protein